MVSSSYKRAASFAKKAAKPPAKTVVFSLMAFLIVAAAPWMIIQTDAVVEDGSVYKMDDDVLTFNTFGLLVPSGSMESAPTVITPDVSGNDDEYIVSDDGVFSISASTNMKFRLEFLLDKEVLGDSKIHSFDVKLDTDYFDVESVAVLYGGHYNDIQKEVLDDGTLRFTFSDVQWYKYLANSTSSVHFRFLSTGPMSEVPEFAFSMHPNYVDDDYTGSIIAFAAGIGLVVLAVLSTPLVNPTRWGKR